MGRWSLIAGQPAGDQPRSPDYRRPGFSLPGISKNALDRLSTHRVSNVPPARQLSRRLPWLIDSGVPPPGERPTSRDASTAAFSGLA
jgi:hypothetical protein